MAELPDVVSDFEAWAHVAAQLRLHNHAMQLGILRDLGLNPERWREVNEDWARLVNEDIAAGRTTRPDRYAKICSAEMDRRRRDAVEDVQRALAPDTPKPPEAPDPTTMRRDDKTYDDKTYVEQRPTRDFRRDLVPTAVSPPLADQIETDPAADGGGDLVEAARQAEIGSSWTVERYAQLMVVLELYPEETDRWWNEAGITQRRARPHVRAHWTRLLEEDEALAVRFDATVAQLLAPAAPSG